MPSQVASQPVREEVETDDRRAMTSARKRRIWEAWEGKCYFCRQPVEQEGPGVVYDHVTGLWLKGSDDDRDIAPIHAEPCNKLKTAADLKRIAKTKRQKAKNDGTFPESTARLRGRGFQPTRRPLP
jgi:hypothetical protein